MFLLIHSVARMMFQYLFTKHGRVDVGVYFCGSDILVTKQGLDNTKVCPSLQQCCSKTMAKGMRRDNFLDAGFFSLTLYHYQYHHTGEMTTTTI